YVATVAAPAQAAATLAHWQSPCQGAATPAAVAPAGIALQAAVPADGCRPCGLAATGRHFYLQMPPLRIATPAGDRRWPPFQAGRGLVVGGWP
ncbi:hypothetical protein BHM03_00032096, partial [Ensete ventricosum]